MSPNQDKSIMSKPTMALWLALFIGSMAILDIGVLLVARSIFISPKGGGYSIGELLAGIAMCIVGLVVINLVVKWPTKVS